MAIKDLKDLLQFVKAYQEREDAIRYAKFWAEMVIAKNEVVVSHRFYEEYASLEDKSHATSAVSVCDTFSKEILSVPDIVLESEENTPI